MKAMVCLNRVAYEAIFIYCLVFTVNYNKIRFNNENRKSIFTKERTIKCEYISYFNVCFFQENDQF